MKKVLIIAGIVTIAAGIICLLYSGLNWFAFYSAMDASNDFYHMKQHIAVRFLIIGAVAIAAGIGGIVLSKL